MRPPKNIEKRKDYRYVLPKEIHGILDLELPRRGWISLTPLNLNVVAIAAESGRADSMLELKDIARVACRFHFNQETVLFTGEPLRYDDHFVVLKYVGLEPASLATIKALFPRIIGLSLVKKEVSAPQTGWYHGENDTDLFLQFNEDRTVIRSLTFISESIYCYWNRDGACKTGSVIRATYAEGLDFAKRVPNPVQIDDRPDQLKVQRLSEILAHSHIETAEKKPIQAILRDIQ